MAFSLPELPYALDALEPHVSRRTLEFHYGKHHQAYVNNLNKLTEGTPFAQADLEKIIREAEGGIFNNGAQVWNHTFYFTGLNPKPKEKPEGELKRAIEGAFGSLDALMVEFSKASATLFGSGWAWLVRTKEGNLDIVQESNAGNPLRRGLQPLLTCDVWEHAYYLDYQNRRPDYIESFWKLVDWSVVEKRFTG